MRTRAKRAVGLILRFWTPGRTGLLFAGLLGVGAVALASPVQGWRAWLLSGGILLAYLSLTLLLAKETVRQDVLRRVLERRLTKAARRPKRDGDVRPGVAEVRAASARYREYHPRSPGAELLHAQVEPLVTVVVVAQNEARYIRACLESIQVQSWGAFRCLAISDASTDRTLEEAWEAVEGDSRFELLGLESNIGSSGARNIGLEAVDTEFVTFVDGDDFLHPEAIERRLQPLLETTDPAWVAGTFCQWHSVAEDATWRDPVPSPRKRARITWLDAVFDAPFIVSSPIVRTSVLRMVGGFTSDLRTAEDFDLWSRVLRGGFVFDPVNYVGVAYRQKRGSLYRRSSSAHAAATASIYRRGLSTDDRLVGPFGFDSPYYEYQVRVAEFRRSLVGLVNAVASANDSLISPAVDQLTSLYEPWLLRAVDVDRIVHAAARRAERWQEAGVRARMARLERDVWRRLEAVFGYPPGQREPSSTAPPLDSVDRLPEVLYPLVSIRRLHSPVVQSLGESYSRSSGLVLMPESAYHVDELGPLAEMAAGEGWSPRFVVSERRLPFVQHELRQYDFPVWTYVKDEVDVGLFAKGTSALVTMNDWGDSRPLIEASIATGIPTFAKIEGVQDFTDADVHWERRAYQTAETILCQGENDLAATTGDRVIVGSSRLEKIWKEPPRPVGLPLAIINVNFTYGVLAAERDAWLSSCVAACRDAGVPYLISTHPAERAKLKDPNVASDPMRHLLTKASVLISRFSTVPFEAMARGVPFIYHNPHGERVPTFADPQGAFPVSADRDELSSALSVVRDWQHDYRSRSEPFFLQQVDIDSHRTSAERTMSVLRSRLEAAQVNGGSGTSG